MHSVKWQDKCEMQTAWKDVEAAYIKGPCRKFCGAWGLTTKSVRVVGLRA